MQSLGTTAWTPAISLIEDLVRSLDRIDTFNNNLRIIDYKSGNVKTNYLIFKNFEIVRNNHNYSNMLQLLFYKLLV